MGGRELDELRERRKEEEKKELYAPMWHFPEDGMCAPRLLYNDFRSFYHFHMMVYVN